MLTEIPIVVDVTDAAEEPPAALAGELAWCLRRFVTGRADEPAMRRAAEALAAWEEWSSGRTVKP